ncbi:MAG TPA: PAS domain S-box protein [Gemmatimonadaceae bacterium]|nr:PAS domain S-box protein [Gemmatimonadaceae bacterium]
MTSANMPDVVEALVRMSPIGMAIFDREMRFVRINASLAEINGLSVEAHLGQRVQELLPDLAAVVEPILTRVLEQGEQIRAIPVSGHTPSQPGVLRQWEGTYLPLEVGGERLAAVYVEERTLQLAAERARREQAEEFTAVAQALPLGMLVIDPSGRYLYANAPAMRLLGMTLEEAGGTGWQQRIHPDDRERVAAGVARVRQARGSFESEHRHVEADGGVTWVRTSTFGIWDGDELRRLVTLLEDVTERRRDAEALRESELRFRTIAEAAPIGILLSDATSRVLYANAETERITGRTAAALSEGGWAELVHPEDLPRLVETMQRDHEPSAGFAVALRVVRGDGSVLRTEAQARNLYVDGVRTGRLTLVSDVTERYRMEAALHESEELFRELAENIDAVFYLARPDATGVDYVSPGFWSIWGRTPAELQEQPELWMDAIHPDDRAGVHEAFSRDRAGFHAEYRIVRPDGSVRWISDRSFPVRNAEGELVRIAGVATDETTRRTLETQLLQAQRLESIGRLAGGVAHDFNNLLTVILSHAAFARQDTAQADEDLAAIEQAGARASELTAQLLAFARRQVIEPRIIDLNVLTTQIDRMLRRLIGEHVQLETALEPQLWPVRVDPAQMEQVLLNLAVNARDAMPNGGTLTLETANVVLDAGYVASHADVQPGEYVMLAVSDNGEGIDPALLPMIFEPFFTTKPSGVGTGLGLATCYGIIRQAGGHIWAYSEPGNGATFKLYLPRALGALSDVASGGPGKPVRGNETVLLVEDDVSVRAIAVRALRAQGFVVLEAGDGIEALEVARQHSGEIHILVTDVVMPRLGGKELAERLVAERPQIKVLFASGYTRNAIVHQGVLEQGTQFLQKPYVPASLTKKVREVLDGGGSST